MQVHWSKHVCNENVCKNDIFLSIYRRANSDTITSYRFRRLPGVAVIAVSEGQLGGVVGVPSAFLHHNLIHQRLVAKEHLEIPEFGKRWSS